VPTDLPLAVLRALRLIEAHGSVVGVEACRVDGTEAVAATVNIKTELPNSWREAGQSPSGVRAIEPISFVFGPGYPVFAPAIFLRADFDRSHPHIQPGDAGDLPEPCLVAGSPREVLRMRGILGLVEQLVEWLERAAYLRLIDPEQGWEPTRRDHIDDIVIAEADWVTGMPTREGGCHAFEFGYFAGVTPEGTATYWATMSRSKPIAVREDLADTFMFKRGNGFRLGSGVALVAWPGKMPDGSPVVSSTYRPETVTTVEGLLARAEELRVRAFLEPKLRLLEARFLKAKMKVPVPLVVLMLVRRPYRVVGTGSEIEICPYVVELSGGDSLSPGSGKPVRAAAHRDDVSVPLFRRASGDSDPSNMPWTLIGCGSVGSKIALHLARGGRGPSAIVDSGNMQPHNYARHSLYPSPSGSDTTFATPKALLLGEVLSTLKQPAAVHTIDVVGHLVRTKSMAPLVDNATPLVVNTTGSASVREVLALPILAKPRPRVAEACLLGLGQAGLLTLEGLDTNPSTVDLITEAYSAIHSRREVRDKVFGRAAADIAIGQGCSAATLALPDSRVSMVVAPIANRLADFQRNGLPSDGRVVLGAMGNDGMSIEWTEIPIAARTILRVGVATEVRISPTVEATIVSEIASRPGSETGGILVGRYCEVADSFHVVGTLPAPPDSKFSAGEFVLGTEGLRPALSELIGGSGGALYPLGTWHNHLVPSGPSLTDMGTAVLLSGMQFFPLLMLIKTPAGYQVMTVETLGRATKADTTNESAA
jgi:hypothetical protein